MGGWMEGRKEGRKEGRWRARVRRGRPRNLGAPRNPQRGGVFPAGHRFGLREGKRARLRERGEDGKTETG